MGSKYSAKINDILEKYKPILISFNSAEMSHKPLVHKWSKKEILGHLIDSAYNNHQRFLKAEKKHNLIFEGYDQNEWVANNNYQNRDVKEIISLFISSNQHIAHLISQLKEEDLIANTSDHNFDKICMNLVEKGKPTSLAYLIEDYIFHLQHHLGQVTGM